MQLGLQSGTVVAVPIPEEHQARGEVIQEAVHRALQEAKSRLASIVSFHSSPSEMVGLAGRRALEGAMPLPSCWDASTS